MHCSRYWYVVKNKKLCGGHVLEYAYPGRLPPPLDLELFDEENDDHTHRTHLLQSEAADAYPGQPIGICGCHRVTTARTQGAGGAAHTPHAQSKSKGDIPTLLRFMGGPRCRPHFSGKRARPPAAAMAQVRPARAPTLSPPRATHAARRVGPALAPRSVSEGTTPEHPTPADPARKCRPPDMPWQRSKRTLLKVIILGDSGVGYVAPWRSAGAAPHSFVLVCDASADSGRPAPHAQQNVAHEPVREQEVQQSV